MLEHAQCWDRDPMGGVTWTLIEILLFEQMLTAIGLDAALFALCSTTGAEGKRDRVNHRTPS